MAPEPPDAQEGQFFPISPLLLFPGTSGEFGVYIQINDRYLLYAHPNEPFTMEQRQKLYDNGVKELWVVLKEKEEFNNYIEKNLGSILDNDTLPIKERSEVFYDVSVTILKDTFRSRLPHALLTKQFERVLRFVTEASRFLTKDGSLKSLASLISHDFQTYNHSMNVFIFATAILQTYELDEEKIIQCGLGAMLHDIGKVSIPREIINKPGRLNLEQEDMFRRHPVKGAAFCANAPLSQDVLNIILFHHERMDGKGYPAELKGKNIPFPVKVVALADAYDAITADRTYAPAKPPFEALTIIRDDMAGHFDRAILKRLISVLSGAELI